MGKTGTAVALLAATVMALGCQGGDDSATPRAPPERDPVPRADKAPTKSKFVAEADALCVEARQRAAPIADAINTKVAAEDPAGVAAELRKALPIAEQLLDGLGALKPPAGDEAVVGRYLDLIAEQKARIRSLVEALDTEEISTIEVVMAELRQGNKRATRMADDYGFTKCEPGGIGSLK